MTATTWTIIKASAGSGKTYRLTELLGERLSSDAADALRPSQIIATTFTRAAAAELTDRIRGTLVERGLLDQAAALPTALIGTVNSVTGRILAEFALDAGRSPEMSVLTDQTQQTAFTLATDHIIADAEEAHRDLLARTGYDGAEDGGFFRQSTNWAATVRRVTEFARSNNMPADRLADFAEASISELHSALGIPDRFAEDGNGGAAVNTVDTRAVLAAAAQVIPARLRNDVEEGLISKRSANGVLTRLDALESFGRRVKRNPDAIPWSEWLKATTGNVPGAGKPTKPIIDAYSAAVGAEDILADPALWNDLDSLIRLVFSTAESCLGAYAEYKEALGLIDFTDQEQLTLQLLRGEGVDDETSQAVRDTLAARYRVLVVDEFQDTSPLQLALFTELAALVEEVVWVGDPKQSIYGFRGSDPALMDSAVKTITAPGGLGGRSEVLAHSYRTRQAPLELSNRVFTRLFTGTEPAFTTEEDVVLTVADIRAREYTLDGDRRDGETVTWPHTDGRPNTTAWFSRIVDGITDLSGSDTPNHRYAVLVRSNNHAAGVREALRDAGIPCTGDGVPLSSTREGQLVTAALARLLDPRDTQATVELISLMPDHPAHATWFDRLTELADRAACRDQLREWGDDPLFTPLNALRLRLSELPVPELVSAVVDALDLRLAVARSTDPVERTGSVTGVLRAAGDYAAEQESAGLPATVAGVLEYLRDAETLTTPTLEPGAVEVHNVHQAKGLEWDTVVVALPDSRNRFTPAGVWVRSADSLSMSDPLAGRELRFWPDTLLAHSEVKETLLASGHQSKRRASELLEEQRLLYVAMTRSKFRTVLAPYSSVSKWQALSASGLDAEETASLFRDSAPVPAAVAGDPADDTPADRTSPRILDAARGPAPVKRKILPATFAPSGVESGDDLAAATVTDYADLGPALVTAGGPEWNLVGDCIHSYLALPLDALDAATKMKIANRLTTTWGVGDRVTADQVVECGERWTGFLRGTLNVTTIRSEVPFTWENSSHQRAQGWIDQLLTLPADTSSDSRLVIVDHKTYPGSDPVGHVRANYLGQMNVYRRALAEITGTAPAQVLIHLPLAGSVLEVTLP